MYYKVDKNKGSIFFQAVYDDAILHIAFLYSWADRKMATSSLAVEVERIMCEKNNHDGVEASTRKSQACFQIIQVSCSVEPRMRLE